MVEVALALGIFAFALLAILALLPLGIKSNFISAEESRAICILSAVEADLRNSDPAGARSQIFGFLLPYSTNAAGRIQFNNAVASPTAALGDGVTTGLDDGERPVPVAGRPRFQASVIYTSVPGGSLLPLQARLVVNWPAVADTALSAVTESATVSGCVETLVSFPAP